MREILKQNYYNYVEDKFLVQTRSQNKASGIKLPAVQGATKTLIPHEIPEKTQQVAIGLGVDKAEQKSKEK